MQFRLTETLLLTLVILAALMVFANVVKPKFEGFVKEAVKPIKVEKVRL